MERVKKISLLSLLSVLVLAIIYLLYVQKLEKGISADTIAARDTEISTLEGQTDKLEEKLTSAQAELDAKLAELDAKKAEVDKATADLAVQTKALTDAQKKIKDQQSQISANSSELSKLRNRPPLFSFSVESSTLVNAEQKKEDVKALVTAAYDEIAAVYSYPYLLHSVTIAFVDTFSNPNAAAEIVISNGADGLALTIKLKDFDKNSFNDVNSVIHELIHSFHGLAILDPIAYEEGITVAAADAVMARLISQGAIPSFSPLYVRISSSQYASGPSLPRSGSSFYSASAADYYQIAGYGWSQIYKADSGFFKRFNEAIYTHKRDGEEITEDLVKQVLLETMPATVAGVSKEAWLDTKAFALN